MTNLNNLDKEQLGIRMMALKNLTLMNYMPNKEVEKYYDCDYEFTCDAKSNIPETLHIWRGKNHNYKEKYHETFEIPPKFRVPLV